MSAFLPVAPIVLWLSKGKVVVEQTFANLMPGGRYSHLLGGAAVKTLAEYSPVDVTAAQEPNLYFATVGTFNQKDKDQGSRLIYRSDIDTFEQSTWDALGERTDSLGNRRPLIIVYDEAHNLTDQQTELLLELEPSAFLVASATMRLPGLLAREVEHLRQAGWSDDDLVTNVDPVDVVESGLVKANVLLGGYEAPMDETLSSMLDEFRQIEQAAEAEGTLGKPKAIYVCKTNIVEGDSFQRDDPKQPFSQRQAPPILIWRHLTEVENIDASEIAVYCSLKFDRNYPAPDEFVHFKGGANDYTDFVKGAYRHVIFNLGLQEGWDDPLVYSAYIDKSMESNIQVEQVIGRLLRQPGVTHYADDRLNTAHFYIRVDRKGVFNELLDSVGERLEIDAPGVRLVRAGPDVEKPQETEPVRQRFVFETAYVTTDAVGAIEARLSQMSDYRADDGTNTTSTGSRVLVQRKVGSPGGAEFEWQKFEHTGMVSARWVFQREVRRRFIGALGVAPTDSPKFDAMVGFGSSAYAHVQQVAADVVDDYLTNVYLKQRKLDPYEVSSVLTRDQGFKDYVNALHPGYSGLNNLELRFAAVIDSLGIDWCRNPSRSGYGIPLISTGPTSTFYPDFLVWRDEDVFAIDTSGPHVLSEKVGRKLLRIEAPTGATGRLFVRFVSPGRYKDLESTASEGYSLWRLRPDGTVQSVWFDELSKAVDKAIESGP